MQNKLKSNKNINYRVGNIVEDIDFAICNGLTQNFAHGCNCCNVMGAGVAGALRKFPDIFKADLDFTKEVKFKDRPGRFSSAQLSSGVFVYNLYTQVYPGKNFSINLLKLALQALVGHGVTKLTIPLIGAGIGGGNWEEIQNLLYDFPIEFDVCVLP